MINKSDLSELEDYCKKNYENSESVIHRWGHISRVARGARWIVKERDGTREEQHLAYASGLLHDIVRPVTEERCHAEASAEKAEEILQKYNFEEKEVSRICKTIRDHRRPPKDWDSELHRSVYLADKVFEHMGAYLDFRACVWAGELSDTDYAGLEPVEAVLNYYNEASDKFLDGDFPDFIEPIVAYQRQWNRRFYEELKNGEAWAEDMAVRLFEKGKGKADFDETLRNFEPNEGEQERWKKEAVSYLDSDLDSSIFKIFLNRPRSGAKF